MISSADTIPKCPDCGAAMVRALRQRTWTYKGKPLALQQPAWYCSSDAAHEAVLGEDDSRATMPQMPAHRAVVGGGLPPSEVKRIRQKLGLSQRPGGGADWRQAAGVS